MSKKLYIIIAVTSIIAVYFGAVSANAENGKTLVVYFTMPETDGTDTDTGASRVVVDGELYGNMRFIADTIHKTVGGDKFEIKAFQEYPMPHSELIAFARNELNNNIKPKLSTHIENLDDYDTIFVGYPIWWGDMPMPLYSFFDEYDFSGKTIIPFSSHGGSYLAGTVNKIKNLEPNANVKDGFTISRYTIASDSEAVVKEFTEWLINFE